MEYVYIIIFMIVFITLIESIKSNRPYSKERGY